jgi:hypothetical protein
MNEHVREREREGLRYLAWWGGNVREKRREEEVRGVIEFNCMTLFVFRFLLPTLLLSAWDESLFSGERMNEDEFEQLTRFVVHTRHSLWCVTFCCFLQPTFILLRRICSFFWLSPMKPRYGTRYGYDTNPIRRYVKFFKIYNPIRSRYVI